MAFKGPFQLKPFYDFVEVEIKLVPTCCKTRAEGCLSLGCHMGITPVPRDYLVPTASFPLEIPAWRYFRCQSTSFMGRDRTGLNKPQASQTAQVGADK